MQAGQRSLSHGLAGAGEYGEIPVFDLGIILNNLLDNAIEACEKLDRGNGFIRLTLKRVKVMAMEITNNYGNYAKSGTGTKKESNVNDYSRYLQGKYSYMNTGTTSLQGVPTTVSVSGERSSSQEWSISTWSM